MDRSVQKNNQGMDNDAVILLVQMLNRSRQRRQKRNYVLMMLLQMEEQRKKRIMSLLLQMLMPRELAVKHPRRVGRNQGWFEAVATYSNKRFKETLRVSRETFSYILLHIRHGLERKTICEEPISPEERPFLFTSYQSIFLSQRNTRRPVSQGLYAYSFKHSKTLILHLISFFFFLLFFISLILNPLFILITF